MNKELFIKQIMHHEKAFRRFLMALCCGNAPLADDIAQESYIRAFLSIDNLKDPASFRFWMFRIAYNIFLSHKRSLHSTIDFEEVHNLYSDSMSDDSFKYQDLYVALDWLPIKERTSILLFYMEGYSVAEIAEITASTEVAVRQQLSRGRNHLRTLIKD